jgi:ABC-type multidrug transport system permease subunit
MINSVIFSALLLFCGVLQPFSLLPGFWTFMYKTSPFTYFIQSFVAPLVLGKAIICEPEEFNVFIPPAGQTCIEFAGPFIAQHGGSLQDDSATDFCRYCAFNFASEVLLPFNIRWSYRWRNFGFMFAYIAFNFFAMLGCYYLMRVRVWSIGGFVDMIKKPFKKARKDRHDPSTNVFSVKKGDENIVKY